MKLNLPAVAFALVIVSSLLSFNSKSEAQMIAPQCFQVAPPSAVSLTPSEDFRTSALGLVQQLLAKGYRNFGELNLVRFAQQIQQTNVRYFPAIRFLQADGAERASACWSFENGLSTVNVSLWMWARTGSEYRRLIAVHEFLGPAQFVDQDYELSSAMSILAANETSGLLEPEQLPALNGAQKIKTGKTRTSRGGREVLAMGGGGVIGVGGGGDWLSSAAKFAFLQAGLEQLKRARTPEARAAAIAEILNSQSGWKIETTWR